MFSLFSRDEKIDDSAKLAEAAADARPAIVEQAQALETMVAAYRVEGC